MIIGASANMNLFTTAVQTGYSLAYTTTPTWHSKIARVVPITNESMVNGWIGMLPRAREWTGPRQVHTPAPYTYLVTPKPFELTWGLDRFRLDDDRLNFGLYTDAARQHGEQDAKVPDYELRDLLFNLGSSWTGDAQKGAQGNMTGLNHWSTVHPVDPFDSSKGTRCNDYRGGVSVDGVTVGGAFSANAFNTVYSDASVRPMESGEAGATTPDLLVASTHLRGPVEMVLKNTMLALSNFAGMGTGPVGSSNAPFVGVADNPQKGWVDYELIEDFGVNASTRLQWMLLRSKGVVKPFSIFLRQGSVMAARVAETDPLVFEQHLYAFGSYQRLAPAWGLWFLSSISGPTAA